MFRMRLFKIRLYKLLCPYWKLDVNKQWNMGVVEPNHKWCKWCPLINLNSVSKAYWRTLFGREII